MAAGEHPAKSGSTALTRRASAGAIEARTAPPSQTKRVPRPVGPFTSPQLARLDEAITMSSRETGLWFTVYVGALGEDPAGRAQELHAALGEHVADGVMLAVSPGERVLQIVTGEASAKRLPNRSCSLAALSMTASFGGGDLVGGIVNGLRMLSDQAGHPPV